MKKLIVAAVLVTLSALGFWLVASPPAQAPEVTFSTLSGKQLKMSELRGKVVLVKFWATSCVTCVAQMPEAIDSFKTFHDQGFETVAVAMQYDPANYVINFVETRKIPFTVALDTQGQVAKAFGDVSLTPTAFLIDKKGQILKRYLGEYDQAEFRSALKKALAS